MGTTISGKTALTAATGDKLPVDRSGSDGYVTAGGVAGTPFTLNTQTDSYTLVLTDAQPNTIVQMNKGSANDLTVPPNSSVAFPTGATITIAQIGAGATTIVAGSGVTVNKRSALTLVLAGQYAVAAITKTGTNTWIAYGDLTAA